MLKIIKKRRSIRQYKNKAIEIEKIQEILKAAMFAPTGMNKRSWEFIVVTKSKQIKQLAGMKKYSQFADQAKAIIVLCAPESRMWIEDLSIAAAFMYLEAVNQGLGICMIQVRSSKTLDNGDCEQYVKDILQIPDNMRVLCMMSLGYADENKHEHDETEYNKNKIHYEKW